MADVAHHEGAAFVIPAVGVAIPAGAAQMPGLDHEMADAPPAAAAGAALGNPAAGAALGNPAAGAALNSPAAAAAAARQAARRAALEKELAGLRVTIEAVKKDMQVAIAEDARRVRHLRQSVTDMQDTAMLNESVSDYVKVRSSLVYLLKRYASLEKAYLEDAGGGEQQEALAEEEAKYARRVEAQIARYQRSEAGRKARHEGKLAKLEREKERRLAKLGAGVPETAHAYAYGAATLGVGVLKGIEYFGCAVWA